MGSINKYCGESLEELHLNVEPDTLAEVTKPFGKVDNLLLKFDVAHLNTSIHALNEMFPSLRHFWLAVDRDVDAEFLDCALPHLERLSMSFMPRRTESIAMNKIAQFLRKNSHVRSLVLENFEQFLQEVNELLPNVENLTLIGNLYEHSTVDDVPIRWENVKILYYQTIRPLMFIAAPKLQELHISYQYIMDEFEWITFFQNHSSIQRLCIDYSYWNRDYLKLSAFTIRLPELTEVYLKTAPSFDMDDLTNFIISHRNLTTFRLDRTGIEIKNALHDVFDDEWHIDHFNTAGILMLKKF